MNKETNKIRRALINALESEAYKLAEKLQSKGHQPRCTARHNAELRFLKAEERVKVWRNKLDNISVPVSVKQRQSFYPYGDNQPAVAGI